MTADFDETLRVFEDDGVFEWPLPTRISERETPYRTVWLLPSTPTDPRTYGKRLRAALTSTRDSEGSLHLRIWRRCLIVAMKAPAPDLENAMRDSERLLFQLIATAQQRPPSAMVAFCAGRGDRFYALEHFAAL